MFRERLRWRLFEGLVKIVEERLITCEPVLHITKTVLVPAAGKAVAALGKKVVDEVGDRRPQRAVRGSVE